MIRRTVASSEWRRASLLLTVPSSRSYGSLGGRFSGAFLNIGDVRLPVADSHDQPERVPFILSEGCKQFFPMTFETRAALRWMAQKELLGQDMCIVGEPGPLRRWLAQTYCHYAKREMQLLVLSRDTTDADIKQRKEILNGTLTYAHQAAVTAALNGQVLVLEGLERAERNVLPIINNLLENREMHLDDGRSIIHPQRYDDLLRTTGQSNLDHLGLLRCSENFRVIALTVPVPKYPGNPLDPPLRSRFQCFYLHPQTDPTDGFLAADASAADTGPTIAKLRAAIKAADAGGSDSDRKLQLPMMGSYEAATLLKMCKRFPKEHPSRLVSLLYPWELLCTQGHSKNDTPERLRQLQGILKKHGWFASSSYLTSGEAFLDFHRSHLVSLKPCEGAANTATATFATGEVMSVHVGNNFGDGAAANAHFKSLVASDATHPNGALSLSGHAAMTPYHAHLFTEMVMTHAANRHVLLIGPSGCGKSVLLHRFAEVFGYATEVMHLFADMSTRDLLQRRVTSSTGDTRWELSPLMLAAKNGSIAVLDGIDNMPNGMLAVLQELLTDACITLVDGTMFLSPERYEALLARERDADEAALAARGVFRVHPSFRVIATAKPPTNSGSSGSAKSQPSVWLNSEVTSMFNTITFPAMPMECAAHVVVSSVVGEASRAGLDAIPNPSELAGPVGQVIQLQRALQSMQVTDPKIPQLTMRQIIHIVKLVSRNPSLFTEAVESALLMPLTATVTRAQLRDAMQRCGIETGAVLVGSGSGAKPPARGGVATALGLGGMFGGAAKASTASTAAPTVIKGISRFQRSSDGVMSQTVSDGDKVQVIYRCQRVFTPAEQALVPHVPHFVPNEQQDAVIQWIGMQLQYPAARILLVGNQGVGKNKVVDYFLTSAGLPRHYIQLHRDTTVGSLTITPTVAGGKVVWEDSPLVKAVKMGHVLVVDEIDKAPVEVVQVLKGLVEDREMFLSDGRRILSAAAAAARGATNDSCILMHSDFRIIVLANPPGYPFHGNDFYRVCGDLFDTYVLQNPDAKSQLTLLSAIAPNVPRAVLLQLIEAFSKLAALCQDGTISYPFSLRELIAVVKHAKQFPQDGLFQALNNVFNFDLMDELTMGHVRRILHETLRADALLRLENHMSPAVPMEEAKNILVVGDELFDVHSPELTLPVLKRNLVRAADFPYHATVTISGPNTTCNHGATVHMTTYSSAEMQTTTPTSFSELKVTAVLPFLQECPQTTVLGSVITAKDLLVVLYSNEVLKASNSVQLTAIPIPGREATLHSVSSGLPPRTAVHVRIPLSHVFSSETTLADIALRAMDPVLTASVGVTSAEPLSYDAASIGATVVLFDHSSSRCIFIDPVRLAGREKVDLDSDNAAEVDDGSAAFATHTEVDTGLPNVNHTELTSARLPVLSFSEAEPRAVTKSTASLDGGNDVISYAHVDSNQLVVVLDAAAFGGDIFHVTMPGVVIRSHFFSPRHAHVVLRDATTGETRHAIVKCMNSRSAVPGNCTLRFLAKAVVDALGLDHGTFVGFQQASSPSSHVESLNNPLATTIISHEDLSGAVVASQGGRSLALVKQNGSVDRITIPAAAGSRRPATGAGDHTPDFDQGMGQVVTADGFIVDISTRTARVAPQNSAVSGSSGVASVHANASGASTLATAMHHGGGVSVFDRNYAQLTKDFDSWRAFADGKQGTLGAPPTPAELDMWYSQPRKKPSGSLKHGEEDPDNTPHVGGNNWAGGTGGTDTAGLGGLVGPYRLDKGHVVHQVDPEQKKQVPKHILDEARRMGQEALRERLREIGMSSDENKMYDDVLNLVRGQVAQLQNMFSSLKAQEGERVWARHQSDGVWDDAKVVEGITGERNIYKRRVESQDPDALRHKKKKRLLFVLDVSASMYRFNGMDQRLNRLIECTQMVMEALIGQEEKIDYAIVGHSGDSDEIPFVDFGAPPKNKKERMDVCLRMIANAQYCWSGDNTESAMARAVRTVTAEDADSFFVFVISDANLQRYGITPQSLGRIIRADERVHMYCIFIASFGAQSAQMQRHLPAGHAFECFDTKQIPIVMSRIFAATKLLGS